MPRPSRRTVVPVGMPAIEDIPAPARAELAAWMKDHIARVEADAEARVQLAKTVIDHPSDLIRPLVKHFAGMGIPKTHIARLLVMSPSALTTHYEAELEPGSAEALLAVAQSAFKIATDPENRSAGGVAMQWLHRRGGAEWKPPAAELAVTKKESGPPIIDSTRLTYEERQAMRAILQRVNAGGTGDPLQPDEEPLIG